MPCDLTDMEVQILYILYRNKNFKINAGYHSEKLRKILRKKYDQDFDEAISHLKNKAYVLTDQCFWNTNPSKDYNPLDPNRKPHSVTIVDVETGSIAMLKSGSIIKVLEAK